MKSIFRIIPRRRVRFSKKEIKAIFECLITNRVINGPHLERFERQFAKYIGVRHAVAVGSGRIAQYLALKALGLKEGDEVLLSSFNFYIVPGLIKALGAIPRFVDCLESSCNIDVSLLEKRRTEKTKFIIATHMLGHACEIDALVKWARDNNIKVVEDCAQSCGAEYRGKKLGSFGDAAYFSFSWSKNINCMGGGMVTTDNDEVAENMRDILRGMQAPSHFSLLKKIIFSLLATALMNPKVFTFSIYPIIYYINSTNPNLAKKLFEDTEAFIPDLAKIGSGRLGNVQAAIGIERLKRVEEVNAKRIGNSEVLNELLNGVEGIRLMWSIPHSKGIWLYHYIFVELPRDEVLRRLIKRGIDVKHETFQACANLSLFKQDDFPCPVAEEITRSAIELPNDPHLNERDLGHIASSIKTIIKKIQRDK